MSLHKNLPPAEIHSVVSLLFANASDRTTFTNEINGKTLSAADVGKIARQTDNDTFWILTDNSPITWGEVGGSSGSVPESRNLTAGAGLTGGGDLSVDRTFDVAAHADGSIVVNANDIQVGVLASDAQHGNRGGGGIHAVATTSVAGFMSDADKTKLDGITAGAVSDHGALSGLGDDDHAQYHNDARGDARYAPLARNITAGAGLTGGGSLTTDRTIDVAAHADGSIVVNANDIQVGVLASDAQHGNRGGGGIHAVAVSGGAAGFMSGADKQKLDGIAAGAVAAHSALTGLGADDHTQYSRADGTRAFTGTVSGITPTLGAHLATKSYVDSIVGSNSEWQDSVFDRDLATPPGSPTTGDRYLIAASPTGAWAGQATKITTWNGSAWTFFTPTLGTIVSVDDENILIRWNGSSWINFGLTVDHGSLAGLGDDDHTQYHTDARGDLRYPPLARTITAGAGLTGGGDLTANRTFNVVANADASIVVNADDIQVGVLASDAQHGNRGGGGIHAAATPSVAGFMSAADKTKLDGLSGGVAIKDPVRAASEVNLTLSGLQTVDGVSLVANDRILVKDQSTGSQNGIYVVSAGAWARSADFDTSADIVGGTAVVVQEGTSHTDTLWVIQNNGAITLGSTALTFMCVGAPRASVTPANVAGAAALGVSLKAANQDHVHTIGAAVVTSAMLRNSAALSVIGRSANSSGVPADIAASADRQYLRRASSVLGFGLILNADLGGDYYFAPQHWLPVGTGWPVTAAASLSADPLAARFLIRRFDDTTQEGVGCLVYIPPRATSIVFSCMAKAITAPPASRNVGWAMGYTRLQANTAIAASSTHNFPADFTLANLNTHPQALTQTFTFASMGTPLVADNWYLIEFYRKTPLGGTNLTGDFGMFGARVEFT